MQIGRRGRLANARRDLQRPIKSSKRDAHCRRDVDMIGAVGGAGADMPTEASGRPGSPTSELSVRERSLALRCMNAKSSIVGAIAGRSSWLYCGDRPGDSVSQRRRSAAAALARRGVEGSRLSLLSHLPRVLHSRLRGTFRTSSASSASPRMPPRPPSPFSTTSARAEACTNRPLVELAPRRYARANAGGSGHAYGGRKQANVTQLSVVAGEGTP